MKNQMNPQLIIRKRRKWLWLILVPLIFVILFELFLRTIYAHKLVRWNRIEYIPDPILGYRYPPNTTFVHSNLAFTNICKTNSHGFSGTDFENNKKEGIYRILIVGASDDTYLFSDSPYDYSYFLGELFKKNNYPIEVINCATDGMLRSVRNIELIKNECIYYNPDLILLRNTMPLVERMLYRETYKGYAMTAKNIAHIDTYKTYIDETLLSKNNFWFKLYDSSYIFRYYIKIYSDSWKLDTNKKFVEWSEKIFQYNTLQDLRLYVRKEKWLPTSQKEFDIWISDSSYNRIAAQATWDTCPKPYKIIKSFSSGDKKDVWIDIDLTPYIKEKITENSQSISLIFSCRPNKGRLFSFASNNVKNDINPALYITHNSDTNDSQIHKSLKPVNAGCVILGKLNISDSVIHVKNENEEEVKGLLKFDLSGINAVKEIEKANLRLFVTQLELGKELYYSKKYTMPESVDTLKHLQQFLESKNIQFSLFDTYKTQGSYAKSFSKYQINYFPLDVVYKAEYSFGKVDEHSTQLGHRAIADKLFEVLINGIIPEEFIQKDDTDFTLPF